MFPAKPCQAGKFKPVKHPATKPFASTPSSSSAAAPTASDRRAQNYNKGSPRRRRGGGGRGGTLRGKSPSVSTASSPRKRQRPQGSIKQQLHKRQHQQQNNNAVRGSRGGGRGRGRGRGRGVGAGGCRLGDRFVAPKGAPFFTGDVAKLPTADFLPFFSNYCEVTKPINHEADLVSSPSSIREKVIPSALSGGGDVDNTTSFAEFAAESTLPTTITTSASQHDSKCLSPISSRKESLMTTAMEDEGQYDSSKDRMNEYSMSIHEIIYGCGSSGGDDCSGGTTDEQTKLEFHSTSNIVISEMDHYDCHWNNHASTAEQQQQQVEEDDEQKEKKQSIVEDNMGTLPPDDTSPVKISSDTYNMEGDAAKAVDCVNANKDSDDTSGNDDDGGIDDEDGGVDRNPVVIDKAYYKELCKQLTFALEKEKSDHRECQQELQRVKLECSELQQRFRDAQRLFQR
ncbi:hypothetical protein ACHAWU_004202 [Discostella pseudostelligera]|uniref:Uncharacterized protein n=1 Tax=Discostella pseudostelligera TaxID=259834 RepID=A0ABD3M823_9STRA